MNRPTRSALFLMLVLSPGLVFGTQEDMTAEATVTHIPPGAVHAPEAAPAGERLRTVVMKGPDFARQEETWQLRPRSEWLRKLFSDKGKKAESADPAHGSWLKTLGELFVWLVHHALWLLALLVLILAYRYRRRWLPLLDRLPHPAANSPQAVIREGSESFDQPLPEDIASVAEALWRNGQPRQALSLLYRGAVDALTLPPPATETENLRLVRAAQTPEMVEAFTRIVRAWQALAWAHQPPGGFEALLDTYRRHFRRGGAA